MLKKCRWRCVKVDFLNLSSIFITVVTIVTAWLIQILWNSNLYKIQTYIEYLSYKSFEYKVHVQVNLQFISNYVVLDLFFCIVYSVYQLIHFKTLMACCQLCLLSTSEFTWLQIKTFAPFMKILFPPWHFCGDWESVRCMILQVCCTLQSAGGCRL